MAFVFWALSYIARHRHDVDIIYATSTPLTIVIPALCAKALFDIPYVFEVRDLWPEVPIALGRLRSTPLKRFAFGLADLAYKRATSIVALSPDMAREITNSYDISVNKIVVAPNGTAQLDYQRGMVTSPRRTVIYAGTLGAVNNPEYLVHLCAAARHRDPMVHFSIFGDGSEKRRCLALANDLGLLDDGIEFRERIPKRDILREIADADLSISTTAPIEALWANSANKVFESIGVFTPVAVNHGGWIARLVEGQEIGVVLHPTDTEVAADQLLRYFDHLGRIDGGAFEERCRNLVRRDFAWQVIASRTLEELERAASASSAHD